MSKLKISKNEERYNLLKERYETATDKYIGEGRMKTKYENGYVYIGIGANRSVSKVRVDKFEEMTLGQEKRVKNGETADPKQELERGEAGITIELSKSTITVKHSTDGDILHEIKNVPEGSWEKIWEAIRKIKSVE